MVNAVLTFDHREIVKKNVDGFKDGRAKKFPNVKTALIFMATRGGRLSDSDALSTMPAAPAFALPPMPLTGGHEASSPATSMAQVSPSHTRSGPLNPAGQGAVVYHTQVRFNDSCLQLVRAHVVPGRRGCR